MAPLTIESVSKLDLQSPSLTSRQRTSCAPNEQAEGDSSGEDEKNSLLRQESEDRNKGWCFFHVPEHIQDDILAKLDYEQLFRAKAVCKWFKARIESDGFHVCRGNLHPREGQLTALYFSVRHDGVWRCAGYDLDTKAWKKFPPFAMLPRLDTKLFKDHFICGAHGIMCVYLSAINKAMSTSQASCQAFLEKMIVFNPFTGRWRELPPLNHPRNPVLMHMVVSPSGDSFKVIVAGSARVVGDEHLSKITEVFDSRTSKWTVTEEFPGPLFALNEFQNGAFKDGIVYCIGFLVEDRGRGLLAYDVEEGKWLPHLACPLPSTTNLNISQVANINGEVVVFSEIELNPYNPHRIVEHRIDILENAMHEATTGNWRNVMTQTKVGSEAGLQIYPEYTCLPFGEGKLCVFNTIAHTGVIYDMKIGKRVGKLSLPPWNESGEMNFYSMNPLTFCFQPSFKGNFKLKLAHSLTEKVSLT